MNCWFEEIEIQITKNGYTHSLSVQRKRFPDMTSFIGSGKKFMCVAVLEMIERKKEQLVILPFAGPCAPMAFQLKKMKTHFQVDNYGGSLLLQYSRAYQRNENIIDLIHQYQFSF
jgi:hypothetical protein